MFRPPTDPMIMVITSSHKNNDINNNFISKTTTNVYHCFKVLITSMYTQMKLTTNSFIL